MITKTSTDVAGLPFLPDVIAELIGIEPMVSAETKTGLKMPVAWHGLKDRINRVGDDGVTTPNQSFITKDLKDKILAGDYVALAAARNSTQQDLQPNLTTIKDAKDEDRGFVTVINQSNGQKYKLCASNSGWLWSYTTSITHTTDGSGKPQTQCVVQNGSYGASGKVLGISYQTLTNIPTGITALAASAMVSYVVGQFIKNLLLDYIYEAALTAAVEAAAADAVAGGFMVSAAAAGIGSAILAGIGAGVVGAIVAIIIFYAADFLHRSYGLSIAIYNWDKTSSWDLAGWYGDNATVAQGDKGSGPWKSAKLLPVQNSVPGPFGPIPATNPVAQYATYAYQNDNEWLEGLGVAMQVVSDTAAFYFGYEVRRFANNLIGVSSNCKDGIGSWYKNSSSWRPSGDHTFTGSIDGRPDLSVTIITTSLNSDRGYSYEVHIGLKESS